MYSMNHLKPNFNLFGILNTKYFLTSNNQKTEDNNVLFEKLITILAFSYGIYAKLVLHWYN